MVKNRQKLNFYDPGDNLGINIQVPLPQAMHRQPINNPKHRTRMRNDDANLIGVELPQATETKKAQSSSSRFRTQIAKPTDLDLNANTNSQLGNSGCALLPVVSMLPGGPDRQA